MAMKDYYEILGVAETATKIEIKKAYFDLVRHYPPEKEPEKFKEYRKAYEVLFDENSRKEYDSINSIPEFYRDVLEYAMEMMAAGEYEGAIDQFKNITDQYPGLLNVHALLAEAYSMNGNTGNAVKILEKLVKLEPDNMAYQSSLGDAYADRGFHKKAIKQFKKTLKLEPDNMDVHAAIVKLYAENGQYRMARENLLMAFRCAEEQGLDNSGLLACGAACCIREQDSQGLNQYLEQIACKMAAEPSQKEVLIASLLQQLFDGTPQYDYIDGYIRVISFVIEQAPELELVQPMRQMRQELIWHQMFEAIEQDEQVPEVIIGLTCQLLEGCDCPSCQVERLLMEMTILEDITEIRKALHYLRNNYADIFALNADFYNNVLNIRKEQWLFDKMYKKYLQYKRRYPEEFYDENDDWDDEVMAGYSGPYIRAEKKIGRNDPCPCGSGKKYKKCCGANK